MLTQKQCECGTRFSTAKPDIERCGKCRRRARWENSRQHRKAREANSIGAHTTAQFLAVIRKQKYLCFWCHGSLRDANKKLCATRGHLMPIARGGSDSIFNIAAECMPCNLEKGDMTAGEYRVFLNTHNRTFSEVSAVPASSEGLFLEEKHRELRMTDLPVELQHGFRALLAAHTMTEPQTLVFRGFEVERKRARRQELLRSQVEELRNRRQA